MVVKREPLNSVVHAVDQVCRFTYNSWVQVWYNRYNRRVPIVAELGNVLILKTDVNIAMVKRLVFLKMDFNNHCSRYIYILKYRFKLRKYFSDINIELHYYSLHCLYFYVSLLVWLHCVNEPVFIIHRLFGIEKFWK